MRARTARPLRQRRVLSAALAVTAAAALACGPALSASAVVSETYLEHPSSPLSTTNDPMVMAVNTVTHKLYVGSEFGSQDIDVFDTRTMTLLTTIPGVSFDIVDIEVDEATNTVYVSDNNLEGITVIDGETDTVNSDEGAPNTVAGLATGGPGGLVYQALGSDELAAYDPVSGSYVDAVAVGSTPTGVAYNSVTQEIFVANTDDGTVSVVDAASFTVVDTISVGAGPRGIAVDEARNQVWVANWDNESGNGSVSIIDATDGSVTTLSDNLLDYAFSIAIDDINGRAYIAGYEDSNDQDLVIYDTADRSFVSVSPGESSYDVVVDQTARLVFVSLEDNGEVVAYGLPPVASSTLLSGPSAGTAFTGDLPFSGSRPATFALESGSVLPPGLTLDAATGALSGTPTSVGTFGFSVVITNAFGVSQPIPYSLTVAAATTTGGTTGGTGGSAATAALPDTGASPAGPIAAAVVLLMLGGAVLIVSARRRVRS